MGSKLKDPADYKNKEAEAPLVSLHSVHLIQPHLQGTVPQHHLRKRGRVACQWAEGSAAV